MNQNDDERERAILDRMLSMLRAKEVREEINCLSALAIMADPTIKGLDASETSYDGSNLRIAIVHARWNKIVIDALVAGAIDKLKSSGVKESNIVIETVPGSFELPLACKK